jgi:hypothetical protein
MTYTAFGSFAPLYIEPKQALARDRVTFFTLEALAWHCDSLGMCWPGVGRLGALVGYANGSIEDALAKLFELDYIRAHVTVSPGGRQRITWQLSPYVLWIVPDHIEAALAEWDAATLRDWHTVMRIESKESQPESLTSSKNQPKTRKKPTPPVTYSENNTNGGTVASGDGRTPPNQQPQHSDKDKATTSANGATPTAAKPQPKAPPSSAPPPPLPPDQERVAESVRDLPPGTRLGQARELVAQYGADRVRIGLLWARQEHRAGRARNPQGLLRAWLQSNYISDDEKQPEDEPTNKWQQLVDENPEIFVNAYAESRSE